MNIRISFVRFVSCLFFPVLIAVLSGGCKKDDTSSSPVQVQGNMSVNVRAMHHTWGVPGLPLYLKKNATVWPGTDSSKYEFKVMADHDGNGSFEHLFPGNYYVYAHGNDSIFGAYVTGYHAIQLNSTTAPANELDLILQVSE